MRPTDSTEKPVGVAELPVDRRGYPIFFTVHRDEDGTPDFRVISMDRKVECVKGHLCAICGLKLDYWLCFIGGPKAVGNRSFSDGPFHESCALYAMAVCPYLANKTAHYYQGNKYEEGEKYGVQPGVITERPDKMALYVTRGYQVERTSQYTFIFRAAPSKRVEWFDEDGERLTACL